MAICDSSDCASLYLKFCDQKLGRRENKTQRTDGSKWNRTENNTNKKKRVEENKIAQSVWGRSTQLLTMFNEFEYFCFECISFCLCDCMKTIFSNLHSAHEFLFGLDDWNGDRQCMLSTAGRRRMATHRKR